MGEIGSVGKLLRVLCHSKKLLAAIVDSFAESSDSGSWDWHENTVSAWFGGAIYQMWHAWKDHSRLPTTGGWLDQPLSILVQIEAVDFVHKTMEYKMRPDADWTKFSATQMDIIRELDA